MVSNDGATMAVTEVVDRLYELALGELRAAQETSLRHAWRLGALLDGSLGSDDEGVRGRGAAADLAGRLAKVGMEVSLSHLYACRRLHRFVSEERIGELVARGLTATHCFILAACDDDERERLMADLHRPDGSVRSTRELKARLSEWRRGAALASGEAAAETSQQAREQGSSLVLEAGRAQAIAAPRLDHAGRAAGEDREAADEGESNGGPQPADLDPDVDRERAIALTKAMARGPKAFSLPPLKAVKTADAAITGFLARVGELTVACDEVERLGIDGDRAIKNFIEAADDALAAVQTAQRVLPEAAERLRRARGSLVIAE